MYKLDLSKQWTLRHEPLHYGKDHYTEITAKSDGWLDVESLPCDVHVPLIDANIIEDPVVSENFNKCGWVENRSWWFRKVFTASEELIATHNSELVIDVLDVKADLFLNGIYLGHHASAMYPFRKDVRDVLLPGENELVIRVTSGLEYYSDLDLSKIIDYISCEYKGGRGPRGDNRRALVRKPQYVYGWDWNPRLATCGIMGEARIEAFKEVAVRNVRFFTEKITDDGAVISVEAEIENLYPISTIDVLVGLEITFCGDIVHSVSNEIFMLSGLNYVRFDMTIADPKLWWPNGMGDQNLYSVRVSAAAPNGGSDSKEFQAGIRTVKLNMDKIDPNSRLFVFEINGVKTFCKGGNWETPDSLYGRISDTKYDILVKEAKEANFNMFRFNGVNAYERDCFYECCDRYGIMIWQDFAGFSCSAYPDELDWFRIEAENEIDWQTKRLRNHPCLVLWCGNNECLAHLAVYREGGYWAGRKKPESPGGTIIYNEIMPRIIRANCPDIPYWNSSPYGGMSDLESNDCGDRHHWIYMSNDMNDRITPEKYDEIACKFCSEFGCIGPTKKSSLVKYYGSEQIDMDSSIWNTHTNTFEKKTIKAAVARHYTGDRPLSLDEYLLYAGMFQGSTLMYAMESMRCAENNYGSLFWSYNDSWGEVGWSIIDYYTTRKIAYYFVKRALAHKKLALRRNADGRINVICMNDSAQTLDFDLIYGYTAFDGSTTDTSITKVTVKPFTKAAILVCFEADSLNDTKSGAYFAKSNTENIGIAPSILRSDDFKNLRVLPPAIAISRFEKSGDKITFTVTSDRYAHGVHFGLGDGTLPDDEYFDLLPGESRDITLTGDIADICADDLSPKYVYLNK